MLLNIRTEKKITKEDDDDHNDSVCDRENDTPKESAATVAAPISSIYS